MWANFPSIWIKSIPVISKLVLSKQSIIRTNVSL